MSKTQFTKSVKFWFKSIARSWKTRRPPARPSRGEIKIQKEFILKYSPPKQIRALVLGATPEIREMLHSLKGTEVTIADINLEMMMAMNELVKHKKEIEKEIWVRASWLDMPLAKNYFDIVCGDFVIENLPFKLHRIFLAKIFQLLKPGGYFLIRKKLLVKNLIDLESILEAYPWTKYETVEASTFGLIDLFGYNPVTFEWGVSQTRDGLEKYINQVKTRNEQKKLNLILKVFNRHYPGDKTWIVIPKEIFERMVREFFSITLIGYGLDHHFSQECPIYFLKKK